MRNLHADSCSSFAFPPTMYKHSFPCILTDNSCFLCFDSNYSNLGEMVFHYNFYLCFPYGLNNIQGFFHIFFWEESLEHLSPFNWTVWDIRSCCMTIRQTFYSVAWVFLFFILFAVQHFSLRWSHLSICFCFLCFRSSVRKWLAIPVFWNISPIFSSRIFSFRS